VNLIEAVELLDAVSNFLFQDSEKSPNVSVYDNQNEGFVLCIKTNVVNEKYRDFLKGIVKSHKLGMRESEGYLMIYGYWR
jgi:hypothetical protein